MSDDNPQQVVLGEDIVQYKTKGQEDPGEVWRREDEQAEEGELYARVAAGPDVY